MRCKAKEPYYFLEEIIKVEPTASAEFEPEKQGVSTAHMETLWAENPSVQGREESDLRCWFWRPAAYH